LSRLLPSLAVAVATLLAATSPSPAAYQDCSSVASYQQVSDGYGRVPTCWVKKVRSYDAYGNPVVKKVRLCK